MQKVIYRSPHIRWSCSRSWVFEARHAATGRVNCKLRQIVAVSKNTHVKIPLRNQFSFARAHTHTHTHTHTRLCSYTRTEWLWTKLTQSRSSEVARARVTRYRRRRTSSIDSLADLLLLAKRLSSSSPFVPAPGESHCVQWIYSRRPSSFDECQHPPSVLSQHWAYSANSDISQRSCHEYYRPACVFVPLFSDES